MVEKTEPAGTKSSLRVIFFCSGRQIPFGIDKYFTGGCQKYSVRNVT
jgi:hypothetical protein